MVPIYIVDVVNKLLLHIHKRMKLVKFVNKQDPILRVFR